MKKNLMYTLIFSTCFSVSAQTATENYIKTTTYTAPSTGLITENDTLVSVTYFDGLGRPKQTVAVRAGGQGQDIVTPVVYDAFGRQTKNYLPYATATQNGNIHVDPIAELEAFYNIPKYGNTTNPYSEKILENSPLNRVMKQGAPGNPWAADPASNTDHSIKYSYEANGADEVRLYDVTTTSDHYSPGLSTYIPALENPGFYLPGRLYKTTTKDENWQPGDGKLHTTEEFKDFQGRIVLKRTYADIPGAPQAEHDTYYVYDKFNNLSYVIPPKVNTSDGVSLEELNELCYQYVYDHRNRLVEKKIPGKGWESIVYNKLDLPVFTQDQNMAANGQWLFTKYDKFGRVIYTGIFSSTDSRAILQTLTKSHTPLYETKTDTPNLIDGTDVYYTNAAFPDTDQQLLTISYYDTYNFDLDGAIAEDAYGISPSTKTKTLTTGSKVRVLETNQWITIVTYYDEKARPIYTYTKNPYLNTTDKIKNKVDFVGKVLETTSVHIKDGLENITSIEKFSYDRMGRLLKQTHQIAGQKEETLAENVYDALGQLIQKKVGNNTAAPLQTVDYSYNIRGWLTQINDVNNVQDDLFSFGIRYNDPTGDGTALYNGNISQTHWRTNNTDSSLKHYTYSYDPLNRITGATDNSGNYNLNSISYDKNGNILSLSRQGHINEAANYFDIMDNLIYNYDSGNKLVKVEDTENDIYGFKDDAVNIEDNTDDYMYDNNGNMLSDTNKGITGINYNHLNLPIEITFNNDPNQKISYFYTADGIKQQKMVNDNGIITTTDYAGGYIYENSALKFISHPEGYIEPDGAGGYDYVYQYKDHLGNIRLSYSDNSEVLTDNSFDSTTEGWGGVTTVLSQENGKLKAEVTNQWAGAQKYFDVAVGDELHYDLFIDKATTEHLIVHIAEHDSGYGKLKNTSVADGADGFISGTYTVTEGSKLRIKITKNGNDNGISTHYYIDDVKVVKKDIAIREENNYYPFGLLHRGYNNLVNGTEHPYKFQGQELSEELDLDMYEFKYRFYDAAIGRFWSVDPLADVYVYNSTYAFQENKLGLGSEFEGKEIRLHDWLVREGSAAVAKELDKKMDAVGMEKTEKSVASKNLYKMYKLQKSGNKEKAEGFAYNSGLPGIEDGPADAFRHSLFNALNTQTVGESFTKELGDAHEEDRPTQKKSAKKMDLHNNEVGREVGENNPDASVLELATELLDKMADGELVTIDSKGNVVKTKLSKNDKSKILKNLQKLNKNGLTPQQQAALDKKKKKSNY